MRFRSLSFLGLLLSTLLLGACGQSANGLTSVKLALDFTPNTNHTGLYIAQAKGYFKQHGLDVTFVPAGATYPEALVGSGQADFGVSFQEYVAVNRAQGQPIVSIAAVVQHNTSELVVLKSSGITHPAQLSGKRLASFGDPAEQGIISTMIAHDGASDSSYQTIAFQNPDIKNLQTGSADFLWTYEGIEGIQARNAGVELTTFLLQDYGVPDFYSPVLIASEQTIKARPSIVRAFLAAVTQGYQDAISNPTAAAQTLTNGAKAQGGTLYGSDRDLNDSQVYMSKQYQADARCWGSQSDKVWTDFTTFLYQNSVLVDANNKPLTALPDIKAMYTNAYLPACQ